MGKLEHREWHLSLPRLTEDNVMFCHVPRTVRFGVLLKNGNAPGCMGGTRISWGYVDWSWGPTCRTAAVLSQRFRCVGPRCSLCRGRSRGRRSVSGPGALCRAPALSVRRTLWSGGLCVDQLRSARHLCGPTNVAPDTDNSSGLRHKAPTWTRRAPTQRRPESAGARNRDR